MATVTHEPAVDRLLASAEPAIRFLARRDLLGDPAPSDPEELLSGSKVGALLVDQGTHPYVKWRGAHWRLVSLVELAAPAHDPRMHAAYDVVLGWLTGAGHRRGITAVDGLVRRCASQEGNALAVGCRLGLAGDPRVRLLAESLVAWQWPDGGWNCDKRATGRRSSFNESLAPLWGLTEYADATGAVWARAAADRTAELFLSHHVFRKLSGEPLNGTAAVLHYPPYWHYDYLQALVVLARAGKARDPRCADALDLLLSKRRPDGLWQPGGSWWRAPGSKGPNVEVVDWGRRGPSEMLTLNALRVLQAADVPAVAHRALPRL